ncbi:MAG: BlaI/MecI/CopY family transcriptional regulator [Terriglobales bacterium]
MSSSQTSLPRLGKIEQLVMDHLWVEGMLTADMCALKLAKQHPMKDSTMRTVLRRLEHKGYLTHIALGRTFFYQPVVAREGAGVRALRQLVDRFWGGSVEAMMLGLVKHEVLGAEQLDTLRQRVAAERRKRT